MPLLFNALLRLGIMKTAVPLAWQKLSASRLLKTSMMIFRLSKIYVAGLYLEKYFDYFFIMYFYCSSYVCMQDQTANTLLPLYNFPLAQTCLLGFLYSAHM